jgi:hypothetical protein
MSFRFRVVDEDWNDEQTQRTIKEVELLEAGPVVFPAYETTSVAVRSLVGALDDETRAALARELSPEPAPTEVREDEDHDNDTSPVAGEPVDDDSPDEPPVASHETPRNRILAALTRAGRSTPTETETSDVDQ